MTPLQKAAQELMDAIVQTDFTCRLGEQLDALEKALADEQAQAVEPMAWIERDMQCDDFDPDSVTCSTPVGTAEGWEWVPLYLPPAPPPAAQVPMTKDEENCYLRGITDAEAHHKIGVKP